MREMDESFEPSVYDYPANEITLEDNTRVIKRIMSARALSHHAEIYDKIQGHFLLDENRQFYPKEEFSDLFYSFEDSSQIEAMT
jgi:hypothetical protein